MTEHTVPDIFYGLVDHVDLWLGDDDPDVIRAFDRHISNYLSSLPQDNKDELRDFIALILSSKEPGELFNFIWNQMGPKHGMNLEGYPVVFGEIHVLLGGEGEFRLLPHDHAKA